MEQKECPLNIYINGTEGTAFSYGRISINTYKSKEGNRISPLGKFHSNSCTQGPVMGAQICGESLRRNRIFA